MKRELVWTSQFKKDYELAMKQHLDISLLDDVIRALARGEALPEKNQDHALTGDWAGHRECCILPDWLLIYRIQDNVLVLTLARTGMQGALGHSLGRRPFMNAARRAALYLTRKYKRGILLFLLLFVVSSGVLTGLSVWNSINGVTKEVQQRLGTGFRLKVPVMFRTNPDYSKKVIGPDGKEILMYGGPALDDTVAEEIRKVEGVTQYDAELDTLVLLENGKLIPGLHTWCYEYNTEDPEERAKDETIYLREVMAYGHTDTSLADVFRTGSFSLIEGRHITAADEWKVLISDRLAELNGFQVGDSITLSNRNGMGGYTDYAKLIGEMKQLEIVGIFHVNGFQPETSWVSERTSTYNYLITDLAPSLYFDGVWYENQYGFPRSSVLYENLTFFVESPEKLDSVMDAVKRLDTVDVSELDFAADDTMYQSTIDPLNTIRNLIAGSVAAIVLACTVVLCMIFTMWIRGRRQEVAIYLSLGFEKASVIGQFMLEAAVVAVAAGVFSFAACQQIPGLLGNRMLTAAIEEAQPQEREITREEIHEAIQAGAVDQLYRYESGDYAGPEQIDFEFRFTDFFLVLLCELIIIIGAVGKAGAYILKFQPRQILAEFR